MIAFKTRWYIFGRVPRHHTKSFSTLSAANGGVISHVVLEVPAENTLAAWTLDWKVPFTLKSTVAGATVHSHAFLLVMERSPSKHL